MRYSKLLSVFLTPPQQGILAATLLQPERKWYMSELARHLRVQPSTIQRELTSFSDVGILRRAEDGNRVYYQADRACPIFPELERLLIKTTGLVEVLRQALETIAKRLDLAFVYGSIASNEEHSQSDVDLMVIGQLGLLDVSQALKSVGRELGREVNPTVYTTEEFQKKVKEGSHFVRTVLTSDLLFIHGTRDDLERLAPAAKGKATPNESAGNPRSPRRRGA
jgi:predicted nucleotidyltransferase